MSTEQIPTPIKTARQVLIKDGVFVGIIWKLFEALFTHEVKIKKNTNTHDCYSVSNGVSYSCLELKWRARRACGPPHTKKEEEVWGGWKALKDLMAYS